jgi:hypothetical protein
MEDRVLAGQAHPEDRPVITHTSGTRSAVKIAVAGQCDPEGTWAFLAAEGEESGELAVHRQPVKSVGGFQLRYPVQVSVRGENWRPLSAPAVGAVGQGAEGVNIGDLSAGSHAENIPVQVPAEASRAVKISIRGLSDRSVGLISIFAVEVELGQGLCLGARRQAKGEGRAGECKSESELRFERFHRNILLMSLAAGTFDLARRIRF